MTAYRIKWKTPEASGEFTGIFPNFSEASKHAEINIKGAAVTVAPLFKGVQK